MVGSRLLIRTPSSREAGEEGREGTFRDWRAARRRVLISDMGDVGSRERSVVDFAFFRRSVREMGVGRVVRSGVVADMLAQLADEPKDVLQSGIKFVLRKRRLCSPGSEGGVEGVCLMLMLERVHEIFGVLPRSRSRHG